MGHTVNASEKSHSLTTTVKGRDVSPQTMSWIIVDFNYQIPQLVSLLAGFQPSISVWVSLFCSSGSGGLTDFWSSLLCFLHLLLKKPTEKPSTILYAAQKKCGIFRLLFEVQTGLFPRSNFNILRSFVNRGNWQPTVLVPFKSVWHLPCKTWLISFSTTPPVAMIDYQAAPLSNGDIALHLRFRKGGPHLATRQWSFSVN